MENFLNIFLLGDVPNDLVSFTFFIGTMAMMAASVFFFLSLDAGGGKWSTSMLVSGLITFIAAVHYYYMRDYYLPKTFVIQVLPDCKMSNIFKKKPTKKTTQKRFLLRKN